MTDNLYIKEIEHNLNRPMYIKEVESTVNNLLHQKTLGPESFTGEFNEHLRKELYQFSATCFKK